MAVVRGTNSGFVSVSPTVDPNSGATYTVDQIILIGYDVSPSTANKITEVGWWSSNTSEEANFEVGLYAADGATVPGEAGTRLFVSATNAKASTDGWKKVTVDWDITPSTPYWLGLEVDNTTTATKIDSNNAGEGIGFDLIGSATTLPDPAGGGAITQATRDAALYAVWTTTSTPAGTNLQVNIGDAWKAVPSAKINIGDVWKDVQGIQVNIGDSWKTIM